MEAIIKLNEIIKEVSPEAGLDLRHGVMRIVKHTIASRVEIFSSNHIPEYFMRRMFSPDTIVEYTGKKFKFKLHGKRIKINIKVDDENKIKEFIVIALKNVDEFTLEDFKFIIENMKKGKNADIVDDRLVLKEESSGITSISLDILRRMYNEDKIHTLTKLGTVKDKSERNILIEKFKLMALSCLETTGSIYVIPIDTDNKIWISLNKTLDSKLIVRFVLRKIGYEIDSYAVISKEEDLDTLKSILDYLNLIEDPAHKSVEIISRLFGYDVSVEDGEYHKTTINKDDISITYASISDYDKILEDVVMIGSEILKDTMLSFHGEFIYDHKDIISSKRLVELYADYIEAINNTETEGQSKFMDMIDEHDRKLQEANDLTNCQQNMLSSKHILGDYNTVLPDHVMKKDFNVDMTTDRDSSDRDE